MLWAPPVLDGDEVAAGPFASHERNWRSVVACTHVAWILNLSFITGKTGLWTTHQCWIILPQHDVVTANSLSLRCRLAVWVVFGNTLAPVSAEDTPNPSCTARCVDPGTQSGLFLTPSLEAANCTLQVPRSSGADAGSSVSRSLRSEEHETQSVTNQKMVHHGRRNVRRSRMRCIM